MSVDDKTKRLAELQAYVEEKVKQAEVELRGYQAVLEIVNEKLIAGSFKAPQPQAPQPQKAEPKMPSFNPKDLLDHPWKNKKNPDGTYTEGSCSYGWDFIYNRERTGLNFEAATLEVLEKGPETVGGYTFSLDGNFVKARKAK